MTAMAAMQAQEAQRRALKGLIQNLLEKHYAAGWLQGLGRGDGEAADAVRAGVDDAVVGQRRAEGDNVGHRRHHVVGIELVATGWLPRIAAAVAQSLLDVAVMLNASRLARK